MHITWHGQFTIKIISKDSIIVIDPYSPEVGLTPFRSKATVVALSSPQSAQMSHYSGIQGDPLVLNTPGEYAFSGLRLYSLGWHSEDGSQHNIQRWHIEDLVLLHLGALDHKLSQSDLQELERSDIDILFLPIGGSSGLTTSQALDMLSIIEPKIVIPIHYKIPKVKEHLSPVSQFASEMGVSPRRTIPKLSISRRKLYPENLTTIILSP